LPLAVGPGGDSDGVHGLLLRRSAACADGSALCVGLA